MRPLLLIPNVLSALRLGLAAWFPFAAQGLRPGILVAAALSDFVDGYIARRLHLASWVGGLLDALADKLMALSVLVTLTLGQELTWWQTGLLLTRDLAVAVIAGYAVVQRKWYAFRHMPARPLGKMTTGAMFVLFLVLTTHGGGERLNWIGWSVAAALSVTAGVDYLIVFVHARRSDRRVQPAARHGGAQARS